MNDRTLLRRFENLERSVGYFDKHVSCLWPQALLNGDRVHHNMLCRMLEFSEIFCGGFVNKLSWYCQPTNL